MIKSICIVRLSALGDVLMLVPLVRALQDNIPDVALTWVISRPAYDLVEGLDGVTFIVIDKPKSVGDYWRFRQQVRHQHFDVLLAPQASFRANLLYPCIKADRKIGYDPLRAKDGHGWFIKESIAPGNDHTLDGFVKFAQPLGIKNPDIRWDLPIGSAEQEWAQAHLPQGKPIVLINPAASKPERSWLVSRYITIIKALLTEGKVNVVLTGGPGPQDRMMANEILKEVAVHDLVGKTKPKQLLAVIKAADLMICPDTGPSHMGAAVGTPVVALHAVTSANVSGPYPFLDLVIDAYPEAVKTLLKQDLKQTPWGTHVHHDEAMALVCVEDVMSKVSQVLARS